MRAIFDNDRIPILIYRERDAIIVEANAGAASLFGTTKTALTGRTLDTLLASPEVPDDRRAGRIRVRVPGGGERIVECHRGRIPRRDDPYAFVLLVDVTEHLRTQELYQQAQKMEVVGRLAGGIAHDFNNLITVIGGYAEMLADKLAPGDPRFLETAEIIRSAKRAGELTRQLLVMSRRGECEAVPVSPNECLDDMVRMLKRVLGEDVKLEYVPGEDVPPLSLDPGQFEQAIMNLAVNARDAMPSGGTLMISTDVETLGPEDLAEVEGVRPGPYVRVSVRDTGSGIPREHMSRLFEPFFTTKKAGEGTGLGLSLVYGIVRRHGGIVHVYSEPGQGTLFTLHFPVCAEASEAAKMVAEAAPTMDKGPTGRILLVEDDDTVRGFAVQALERAGHQVVPVESAEAARLAFADAPFDLLVTDVVLSGENGVSLAESILFRNPGIGLLLTSGYPDSRSRWEEIVGRGYRFLQKPYTARRLGFAVSQSLAGVTLAERRGAE